MKRILSALALLLVCLAASPFVPRPSAQTEVDRSLEDEIFKIKAIDNHAHPMRATREGEQDREFDALIPDVVVATAVHAHRFALQVAPAAQSAAVEHSS